MRSWLGVALVARAITGCTATPDLDYVAEDGQGDATTLGDAALGADAPTDAVADADAATTRDAGSAGDGAADAPDEAPPPPPCPSVDAAGVGCCAGPDRTCVGLSCTNCMDCRAAHCGPAQVCCPVVNGGGKYKGTVCKDTAGC